MTVVGSAPLGSHDAPVDTALDGPAHDSPLHTAWRVRDFEGRLAIIDVVVEGVSIAMLQRQEFAQVLSRDGIEALLAPLRQRIVS